MCACAGRLVDQRGHSSTYCAGTLQPCLLQNLRSMRTQREVAPVSDQKLESRVPRRQSRGLGRGCPGQPSGSLRRRRDAGTRWRGTPNIFAMSVAAIPFPAGCAPWSRRRRRTCGATAPYDRWPHPQRVRRGCAQLSAYRWTSLGTVFGVGPSAEVSFPRVRRVVRRKHGLWRSLVAHYTGGVGVAGSNPVSPTTIVAAQTTFSAYAASHRAIRV